MRRRQEKIFLSESTIKDEKQEIERLERMLEKDRRSGRNLISDEALFKKEIEERKRHLEEHTPHKLTGQPQNRAYEEAKKLKKDIQEALLSHSKFHQPYPKANASQKKQREFQEAVEHETRILRDQALQEKMIRYKELMTRIDPDDPRVRNLENLRGR